MKAKFLALVSILFFYTWGLGANINKNEPISSFEEEINRLDNHEKEIQNLLGRIEVLEHSLSRLQQNIDALNNMLQESEKNQKNILSSPENDEEPVGINNNDVFEATSTASIDLKLPAKGEKEVESNVSSKEEAQDKKTYNLALAALKDGKFEVAEKKFSEFIKKYPKSNLQSNAYFWYGESFYRRKMFDKAAVNYLKGYKQFPKGAKASDSLLKLSLALGEMKKKQEACNILAKLEADFPSRSAISIKRAKDAKIKFGCK